MDDFKPKSDRFASESKSSNVEEPENKKPIAKKVVKAPVKVKKKSILADLFMPEDIHNARDYIVRDIFVPLIKKGVSEAIDSILWPDGGGPNTKRRNSNGPRVSYGSYYQGQSAPRREEREPLRARTAGYEFKNVTFETKGDALDVLADLESAIESYGHVSVRAFYDMVGVDGRHTDVKYGWSDLSNADVIRDGSRWLITLPRPKTLD